DDADLLPFTGVVHRPADAVRTQDERRPARDFFDRLDGHDPARADGLRHGRVVDELAQKIDVFGRDVHGGIDGVAHAAAEPAAFGDGDVHWRFFFFLPKASTAARFVSSIFSRMTSSAAA